MKNDGVLRKLDDYADGREGNLSANMRRHALYLADELRTGNMPGSTYNLLRRGTHRIDHIARGHAGD